MKPIQSGGVRGRLEAGKQSLLSMYLWSTCSLKRIRTLEARVSDISNEPRKGRNSIMEYTVESTLILGMCEAVVRLSLDYFRLKYGRKSFSRNSVALGSKKRLEAAD